MRPFNMYQIIKGAFLIGSLFLFSCTEKLEPKKASQTESSLFNEDIQLVYVKLMDSCAIYLKKMNADLSREENQVLLSKARKWYKKAEPIIIAYDYENYKTINAPNLLKIEIDDYTDIKKMRPHSFQVLEELLYNEDSIDPKILQSNISFLSARIPFMAKNHMIYTQTDQHHLKLIRDAIINIATKGLTGFDSPVLSNSLEEAIYNYETVQQLLIIFKEAFNDINIYNNWMKELESVKQSLNKGQFDSYDRYHFIKHHSHNQLHLINLTASDWGIKIKPYDGLNPEATQIFSRDFFDINKFSPPNKKYTETSAILGKKLFNDSNLSMDGKLSCASCHHSDKAFTDGLKKGIGNDGKELLRNTPTLTYAVYQRKFFYDAVSTSLEGQIINVIENPREFHIDFATLEKKVKENKDYHQEFDDIYDGVITARNIRNAISNYVRTLAPFDSKFDRNIQGLEQTLSQEEKLGFNLFMGKAACGTCHFAPSFFGTVPPKYDETELENLGVPATPDFNEPMLDQDIGAYEPYKVDERKFFFKTSTVRNIAMTAPYMHNGVFESLEEVIRFYDSGGGAGMGIDNPYQTLPSDSLHLQNYEKEALIAFMQSLTDSVYHK